MFLYGCKNYINLVFAFGEPMRTDIDDKIIKLIERKGSVSLEEIKKLGIRQSISYSLKKLYKEKVIRSYTQGVGLNDSEILFTNVKRYERAVEIKELLQRLCINGLESQDFEDFKALWLERFPQKPDTPRLDRWTPIAKALIAGVIPGLEDRVTLILLVKGYHGDKALTEEESEIIDSFSKKAELPLIP